MISSGQIKGAISYLTKLTHTVDEFRISFINIEYDVDENEIIIFECDLNVQSKKKDIPWLWDFFHCKSKHIIEESFEIVGINFNSVKIRINEIYVDGFEVEPHSGYIPDSFINKVSEEIQNNVSKQIKSQFYCGGKRKEIVLIVNYEVSDIYIDDGLTTNISVYCSEVLIDGEPLKNITKDLAETIVGYFTESESIRMRLDAVVWDEITQYMNLAGCEIWTYTYAYIKNIGEVEVEDFNIINHSLFSSNLCDFITGDY